jgi:hypothetical protein
VGDTANLSRRTKAPNERRQPDLKVLDFAKGILPLWTLGKLVCSIPQIGKHCDNLLHLTYLKYFNGALDQCSFLPKGIIESCANIDAIRGGNESVGFGAGLVHRLARSGQQRYSWNRESTAHLNAL